MDKRVGIGLALVLLAVGVGIGWLVRGQPREQPSWEYDFRGVDSKMLDDSDYYNGMRSLLKKAADENWEVVGVQTVPYQDRSSDNRIRTVVTLRKPRR